MLLSLEFTKNKLTSFRLWFLQPLKNIEKLKERHEAVSFFADQRYMEITLSLQKCLHQIKDTKVIALELNYFTVFV